MLTPLDASVRTKAAKASAATGSRPLNGSSRRRTFGEPKSAAAIDNRCLMPWLRLSSASSRRVRSPTRANNRSTFFSAVPRISPSCLSASYTVVRPCQRTCSGMCPTHFRKSLTGCDSLDSNRALICPFCTGRIPAIILRRVVFPAPFGPISPKTAPSYRSRDRPTMPGPSRVAHGLSSRGAGMACRC